MAIGRHSTPVLCAMLLWLAAASPAGSCAFDGGPGAGLFDKNFQARYPQSSTVYFAIVDAVDQGLLDASAFQVVEPGPAGYWRAAGRLNELARRLSAAAVGASEPPPAISLVLIESDLWARFVPGPKGVAITLHTPGPVAGDLVITTSEGGLAAALEGRLSATVALDRGLIALDSHAAARGATRKLLVEALDPAAPPGGAAPARLFGPAR